MKSSKRRRKQSRAMKAVKKKAAPMVHFSDVEEQFFAQGTKLESEGSSEIYLEAFTELEDSKYVRPRPSLWRRLGAMFVGRQEGALHLADTGE